jgi:uncharacterized protein YprB with RNaseH-like and TPR domain
MREDLRRRLRELGVVRGVRELRTHALSREGGPTGRRAPIEDLVPGHFHTTSHGQCFVVDTTYPPDHLHGDLPLDSFLDLPPHVIAQVARDAALVNVDLRRVCFLDTETTGLSGGTGTMAFVVGLGFFLEQGFRVRQYFLRDPGDEPAMIEALAEDLAGFEALASFNGRTFDVPIIENRFILARVPPPTVGVPHLDLRLWRYHLPSCALGTLEREVLGILREQDDVPGGVIPTLYRDYLRTGDAREMKRVLYHNAVDVLSLVTLAARLCRTFANTQVEAEVEREGHERSRELSSAERYGLGRWHEAEDQLASAERAYGAALGADSTPGLRARALRALGFLLKRADRRAESFAYWQQLALEAAPDTADFVLAHVELAKYFEWHVGDLSLARGWTRAALTQVEAWPSGMRRDIQLAELHHRLTRLERKLGQT